MRGRKLLVAALGAALIVPTALPAEIAASRGRFPDLRRFPKPKISGAQIIKGLEDFVERFPLRQNMLPNNVKAAKFLAKDAEKVGFESKIIKLKAGTPSRTVRVVQAIKRGTERPNDWITLVAHYDVIAGAGFTVQGAYDDGSGTNMMRYLARALSKVKTKKSIVLMWFDAEENGLLASRAYADKLAKRRQKMTAVLGFDMVGIGYPAPYCICIYHGAQPKDPQLALPLIDHVNFKYLDFPKGDGNPTATQGWPIGGKGHVCSCGTNIRNSDEQSFGAKGYFTLRWTGMRRAADYPGYHQPWDTVPFMEQVAEGRKNLEKGSENTLVSAYYTILALDRL